MQQVEGEIVGIRQETHDVKTFRIKLEGSLDYTPGQYCLVSIIDTDQDELDGVKRPFTFASPPGGKETQLTVKRLGQFTTALHNLTQGDKLKLYGPRGEALNFDESISKDIVFLAGGSGITPFMAILRYAVQEKLDNEFKLLFSNKTERDIIYRDELSDMSEQDNITVIHTLDGDRSKDWKGETGHIDREMIEKYVTDVEKKLWYICGPPPMVDAMKRILKQMKIPAEKLRAEDWELPGKHDN